MKPRLYLKAIIWLGSTREDLKSFPSEVVDGIGFALFRAQQGLKHASAKPLKGFKGAGVLEIVENCSNGTYRAIYTVLFQEAIFVLHVFQKKSKHGIATPEKEMDLIRRRLSMLEAGRKKLTKR